MKKKIQLYMACICLLAVIVTTLGITYVFYNTFETQVKSDLKMTAELLEDIGVSKASVANVQNSRDLRITWIDTDGSVIYDNDADASKLGNHKNRPEVKSAFETGEGECVRNSSTLNMNTYYYALRLKDGTVLRVATEAKAIASVFETSFPLVAAIALLIMLCCLYISHILTRKLVSPIDDMAETLKNDGRVATPQYPELEPFADKIRSQHENILAAAKSRQDFTANISHELKTPLAAITGYAELIENHMAGPEQDSAFAQKIRNNADRLVSLINDIIELSELDHKERERTFEDLDLSELAEDCCRNLQINAEQRKVTLHFEGDPAEVSANRELICELITNLVQNAIRYNKDWGKVDVTTGMVDGRAYLSVVDTGIGIPKDSQERVFERFYRVDKSHSRETGGTGLGLAIVKHITEIHNAEIYLRSELGKGTEIIVRF